MKTDNAGQSSSVRRYGLLLGIWTVLVCGSLVWDLLQEMRNTLSTATVAARANINKDIGFRRWATSHGGVYVPPTEHTPPNPYLKVPDRDVVTTTGKTLTLMNPAYMLRELQTDFPSEYGNKSHITSLKLLNPNNAPDAWETGALRSFERGEKERLEVQQIDGQPYLRMMRPLIVEQGCLKCHGFQGYKVGDIRGGISTSVSLVPYQARERELGISMALTHGAIWMIGLAGLGFSYRSDRRQTVEREKAAGKLRESEERSSAISAAVLDALIMVDDTSALVYWNPAAERILGYRADEVLGKPLHHLLTPQRYQSRAIQGFNAFRNTGQGPVIGKTIEIEALHKDGHEISVELSISALNLNGRWHAVGVLRDINERKQSQSAFSQLAAIVETSNDAIIGKTVDGTITSWNKGAERIYGYTADEVIGKPVTMLAPPSRHAEIHVFLEKIRKGETVANYESERIRKDGTLIHVALTLSPIMDASGHITGISTIARDITEKKRMEEELRQASVYTRSLIEASQDPLVTISVEGKITDVNQATEDATGRSRSELIGTDFSDYFTEPDKAREGYRQVFAKGFVTDYPLALRHRDGHVTDVLYNASIYRDEAGEVLGVFAAARDVTERKRAENQLRAASLYTRSLIEASVDPLVTISAEGKITDVNRATEAVTGRARSELIGTDFSDYFTEPDKARGGYQQVFARGFVTDYPLALRHRDGHVTDVLYNASVYRNEAGEVLGVFAAARDVTERNKAEREVAQLSIQNKLILDSMGEGIYGLDIEGRCTFVNPAALQLLGFSVEELRGQHSHSIFHHTKPDGSPYPEEECPVQAVYKQGVIHRGSDLYWRKDGSSFPVEFISTPIREEGKITGAVVAFRDITELKLAEEQLRRSEHGLAEAQRIAHLGNWELDLGNNVLTWSDEIYRIFEIDPEKFGASYEAFLNAIHPDDREMVNNAYSGSLKDKVPYDIVHRLQMQDGRIKYVNEKCETYFGADGKPLRSVGTVHDITERKLDEEALQRLNRELRAISNCNQSLMRAEDEQALLDEICRIICEDAGYRMAWVGYPENDEAKTIRPVSRAGVESGYLEQAKLTWADTERGHGPSGIAIRSGESVSIQDFMTDPQAAPWRDAAAQRGYRSSISLPLKDESVKTFGILNIYAAIPNAFTPEEIRLLEELAGDMAFGIMVLRARIERQRVEESLRQMNERFSLATHAGRLGVWDWDLQKNELVWDDRMYELYGVRREDFAGAYDAWLKGVHPDDRAYSDEISMKAQRGERKYDTEFRVVWPDGSIHYLKAYGQFARDAAGKPLRMTGVNYDITELKEAEDKIIELNHYLEARVAERTAQLEAANKELEAFSYSVSHDLRTPLRAIDGFSRILLDDYRDKLDDEGKRLLKVVRDNTSRMGQLIDDILKFSRTGRLEMTFAEIDMERLAREVFAELQPSVDSSKLQLEIEHIPAANGDSAMMRQVFVNLLSNAIKFTRNSTPAKIKVGCSIVGDEAVYYVKDNGAGFDMQYASKLFGVFQRLHAVTEFEGTGIGLAIVKRIITRHGGRVWAEGKVNEGATMYFALPAKAVAQG